MCPDSAVEHWYSVTIPVMGISYTILEKAGTFW